MISRRTIAQAAWTAPVIAACAPVPAFATSRPLTCAPTARCKRPGSPKDKSYIIDINCTSKGGYIKRVEVQDVKTGEWIQARIEFGENVGWVAPGFNDSRRDRPVRITDSAGQQQVYTVSFPPC